mmetsp:Transcript_45801/g.71700  ORF Transcript_45801/g.71700 Transcript_45801/m.71700 type:complete len:200 (-) Transcript_45801:1346-1945(-)
MPEVGSSRNTTFELPMNAMATLSFRFCPPERFLARKSLFSVRPTSTISFSTSAAAAARGTPLQAANSARCSRTVSAGYSTSCCGHTPSVRRMNFICVNTSRPWMKAAPPVGASRPVSIEIVVVLPAPLWPSSAVICPRYMVSPRSCTAFLGPVGVANTLSSPRRATQDPSASCACRSPETFCTFGLPSLSSLASSASAS